MDSATSRRTASVSAPSTKIATPCLLEAAKAKLVMTSDTHTVRHAIMILFIVRHNLLPASHIEVHADPSIICAPGLHFQLRYSAIASIMIEYFCSQRRDSTRTDALIN